MILPGISRRRIYWLLAGALLVGMVAGGLWSPSSTLEVGHHEAAWSLPPVNDLQRHVAQDYAAVIRDMPWVASGGVGDAEDKAAIRWRLAGIITDAAPLILVMTPEQPTTVLRVQIGDPLPDESVLDAIEHDQALVRRGECITTWRLFRPQPIAASDACQAQDVETPVQGTSP